MLLIVCNIKFITLAFSLPSLLPATELNPFFVVPLFVNQALHRGEKWIQSQITHRAESWRTSWYHLIMAVFTAPHTKITCANKNQFGSLRTTSSGSRLVCQKLKKKKRRLALKSFECFPQSSCTQCNYAFWSMDTDSRAHTNNTYTHFRWCFWVQHLCLHGCHTMCYPVSGF